MANSSCPQAYRGVSHAPHNRVAIERLCATGSYVEYKGKPVDLHGIELVVIGKYLREDGIQVELPFAKHLV